MNSIPTTEKPQESVADNSATLDVAWSQFRILWEKAPLSIMLFDPCDSKVLVKIVDCNPRACAIHGYTREELIGQCVDFIEFQPWTEKNAGNWLRELRQHDRLEGHGQHKRKDGTVFPIESFTNLIVIDGHELVLRMDLDVTARIAAEGALGQERNFSRALLNSTRDYIYFKDRESRFLMVSQSVATNAGLDDPAKIIGKTDFDFSSEKHARKAFEDEQRIMETGQPLVDVVEKETLGNGKETWALTTKSPLRDENGEIIGTYGITRDITERMLSEQSCREMETQLQLAQKLESIGRLAAGVAHEINTPTQFITDNLRFLTGAFAQIEAMLVHYRALRTVAAESPACTAAVQAALATESEVELDYLSTEIPTCLKQSLDGLARVARIVASLKEFAHPNSPKLTPVDLNRVIENSIIVSRHEWKYVAEVISELDPNLPPVPCVVDEFNQVMLNLIVNAAHAIGDALKESGASSGQITIRTRHEAPWAVVEVEDTGTGIPKEIQPRVFEPFFTTKTVGKGTGQGLAIVQTVVVKHRGTIGLMSEPGHGTKFTLRFPLVTPP